MKLPGWAKMCMTHHICMTSEKSWLLYSLHDSRELRSTNMQSSNHQILLG